MGEHILLQIKQTVADNRKNGKKKYAAFGALGDPSRFLIFKLLIEYHEALCVSDVAKILDMTISAASQQLKALETKGLVERKRAGRKIRYIVKHHDPIVASLINVVNI